MVKRLVYVHMKMYKTSGIVISKDACGGCFERMALPIGLLAFQRLGAPKQAIRSLFGTLSKMKHYIRATHSDLDALYSGTGV